jgi:hypothetical protein
MSQIDREVRDMMNIKVPEDGNIKEKSLMKAQGSMLMIDECVIIKASYKRTTQSEVFHRSLTLRY